MRALFVYKVLEERGIRLSLPIIILIVGILIFLIQNLFTKNQKLLKKFRQEWDSGQFHRQEEDFESVESYWLNKKNEQASYFGVDRLTWKDLSMDEVFHRMNYTQSSVGSEYFFNQLRDIRPTLEHLQADEQLYTTFQTNQTLREQTLLILAKIGKKDYANTSSFFYSNDYKALRNGWMYRILACLPFAALLFTFFQLKLGLLCLFGSFVLNGIVYYRNKSALEYNLHSISYSAAIIRAGKQLSQLQNSSLTPLTDELKQQMKPLKKVLTWSNFITVGQSGGSEMDVFFEYFRILFLIDFLSYNKVITTISKHSTAYRSVWEMVGKIDTAIAVAFYRHSLPTYCTPQFHEEEKLDFTNMVHPLIQKAVPNSSTLGKNTLITGSNASGKSTYIKAVAINAILAQSIHTVLAESWTMKPSYIVTSMAVQDNVLDGDSYFMAEIKSLQRIFRLIENEQSCMTFVDELLKGTNTIERIAASAAIMHWLSTHKGMNMTASHDIELTEMMKDSYTNYHFKETIEDGDVRFDYTIHEGPSLTRNAIKLLEVLQYPRQMTIHANHLAENFMTTREWPLL